MWFATQKKICVFHLLCNLSFSFTPQPFFLSTLNLSYLSLIMDVLSSQGSQESEVSESIMLNEEAPQKKRPTCVLCGHVSTTEAVHRTHVNEAHDGRLSKRIKPLQCLWCPKVFQSRKGLKKHCFCVQASGSCPSLCRVLCVRS